MLTSMYLANHALIGSPELCENVIKEDNCPFIDPSNKPLL